MVNCPPGYYEFIPGSCLKRTGKLPTGKGGKKTKKQRKSKKNRKTRKH